MIDKTYTIKKVGLMMRGESSSKKRKVIIMAFLAHKMQRIDCK